MRISERIDNHREVHLKWGTLGELQLDPETGSTHREGFWAPSLLEPKTSSFDLEEPSLLAKRRVKAAANQWTLASLTWCLGDADRSDHRFSLQLTRVGSGVPPCRAGLSDSGVYDWCVMACIGMSVRLPRLQGFSFSL